MASARRRYWGFVSALPAPIISVMARQAEAQGLEGLFAAQVYGPPWIPLAAAAMATERVKLASGIALILKATLIGLLIAIPALIAWTYYSKKVEMLAVEMETLCDEFMRRQYREGKP